ncbi:MAG: Rieske (2Fe-2S) protein [Mycobacterium sp.]|nr:Rieske (2Fe-2S) protein [Mycobacterium sp.]
MSELPRRSVLIGAALCPLAAPLAGCGTPGQGRVSPPPAPGQVLAPVTDVAVGAAKIVDGTLITQPSTGVFKGFVARCTHAGCALAIKYEKIECPCHGSQFELDGAVLRGPAMEPLVERKVTVRGGEIVAG